MENKEYPILEFDPTRKAIVEPKAFIKPIDVAEHCVLSFFTGIIKKLKDSGTLEVKFEPRTVTGVHPLYEMTHQGKRIAVFHPGIGAPLAAGMFEELIARGCKKFIACGGSGVLDKKIGRGGIVVVSSAVRDEGTSYHYCPPSREIEADPNVVARIEKVLKSNNYDYVVGKTWTTDAFFRETPEKIRARKLEGCITVEMEAAALFAVAQFRGVPFGQILEGGDDVSGAEWDPRYYDDREHKALSEERVFWLAVESCLEL